MVSLGLFALRDVAVDDVLIEYSGEVTTQVGLHPSTQLEFGIAGTSGAATGILGARFVAYDDETVSVGFNLGGGVGGNYKRKVLSYGGYLGLDLGVKVHRLVRLFGGARYQPRFDEESGVQHWLGGAVGVQLDFDSVWVAPELGVTSFFDADGRALDTPLMVIGLTFGLRLER